MIQIDIKMPVSCEKCPCKNPWIGSFQLEFTCGVNKKRLGSIYEKPDWCPLIEVKE
jgi:hypothetical protein